MIAQLAGGALALTGFLTYAVAWPRSQVFGPAVSRVPGAPGRFALTFDDGPSESTPAVLEVLARHRARATFFMCGSNALRLPGIARRVLADGHEIGNHTLTHPYLYRRTPGRIRGEIDDAQEVLCRVLGMRPSLFRPPFGVRWFGLYRTLRRHGLTNVMWCASVHDWSRPADAIARALLRKTGAGAIVLMHDGDRTTPGDRRSATARALDQVLPVLAARGLHSVTVSELLATAARENALVRA